MYTMNIYYNLSQFVFEMVLLWLINEYQLNIHTLLIVQWNVTGKLWWMKGFGRQSDGGSTNSLYELELRKLFW